MKEKEKHIVDDSESKLKMDEMCKVMYQKPWNRLNKDQKFDRLFTFVSKQVEESSKVKKVYQVIKDLYISKKILPKNVKYDKEVGLIESIEKLEINEDIVYKDNVVS